jgi:hypothetical protein
MGYPPTIVKKEIRLDMNGKIELFFGNKTKHNRLWRLPCSINFTYHKIVLYIFYLFIKTPPSKTRGSGINQSDHEQVSATRLPCATPVILHR